jgi:hypothetical protein
MGSGGSKTHESFAVAPGTTLPGTVGEEQPPVDLPAPLQAALEQLAATDPDGTPAEQYQALKQACAEAYSLAEDLDPQAAAAAAAAIKQATGAYLGAQSTDTLIELAAGEGFAHPHLVGFTSAESGSTHPLVHYLDPAYPDESASKAAIAAKAEQRYAQLAAGETVHGHTLAEITQLEQQLPAGATGPAIGETITPAEALALSAKVTAAATEVAAGHWTSYDPPSAASIVAMLAAENKLAHATCPDAVDAHAAALAAARGQVDAALAKLPLVAVKSALADQDVQAMLPASAKYLAARDQLALARTNLDQPTAQQLLAHAEARDAAAAKLQDSIATFQPTKSTVLAGAADPTSLPVFAKQAASALEAKKDIAGWKSAAYDPSTGAVPAGLDTSVSLGTEASLTAEYTAWAKQQPLPDLRAAAAELGLTDPATANRAQITKYIAATWDTSLAPASIQEQVTNKAAAKAAGKAWAQTATAASPTSTPSAAGTAATTPAAAPKTRGTGKPETRITAPPSAATWMAEHQRLVDALKHHQATATALPARQDPSAVAGWTFTPAGNAGALGGKTSKTYLTGPDGGTWLFKPDVSGTTSRAHSEVAAARVYHAVNIPAVDVHLVQVAGKHGSAQPLLPGVAQLPDSPKSWTQADVDAIVRYHVAAWAVGDHDAKSSNVLRTQSGGLIPCDGGQAFRFYGHDSLSSDYHPLASSGAPKGVFHQAYSAAAKGTLAPGVTVRPEAAAGVLAAFERIPDSQYRALLHECAQHGAKNEAPWAAAMRARAAKRHKTTQAKVTTAQVANEFLDTAVARKNGLRAAFVDFFSHNGHAAGAAKLQNLHTGAVT